MTDFAPSLWEAIAQLPAENACKSRDWGRGYAKAIKDVLLLLEDQATPEHLILSDGFGSEWVKCGEACEMEVVRPGKVQCVCD